jgi:D-proline reductase (dithiol) PrdB
MAVEHRQWVLDESEKAKFQTWMDRINTGHTGTRDVRNQQINWTPLKKPLSQCTVSLFTTGGVHLQTDEAFDVASAHGDWTFRQVPTGVDTSTLAVTHTHYNHVDTSTLAVTHTHYNHVDADRDVNCMFPLDRLRELADQGVIGGIAPNAYSIMGFNPDPARLIEETAPELARRFQEEGADLVLMTCG